jgi:ubiquinone/menaquinone biosynthesis C-methylase UbiE
MKKDVFQGYYLDVYDRIVLNSDMYLAVRDFHVKGMEGLPVILDSGAGTGNVTLELLKKGHSVCAVDKSSKALGILSEKCKDYKNNLQVYETGTEELPFESGSFDGITSMFVVSYVDDIERYFRENYRVLKEGGILVLTGRVTTENSELVLKSYEKSLRDRNLLSELERGFELFKKEFREGVMKSFKGYSYNRIKNVIKGSGFGEIREVGRPYFMQCYSLIAKK